MLATIKSLITDGLPTLATCAGLILLAGHIDNDDSIHIGTLPVTVKRNAYGMEPKFFRNSKEILRKPELTIA